MHIVLPETGYHPKLFNAAGDRMFCHSPESWREVWENKIFKGFPIKMETQFHTSDFDLYGNVSIGDVEYFLVWSIVRL